MTKSLDERFSSHYQIDPDSGCWLWDNALLGGGYGQFSIDGRPVYAHRFSYIRTYGAIPDGLQLDHLCRTRHCVNPAHLEAVTCRENLLRGETLAAKHAAATHCPHGHAYDDTNTYRDPRGYRQCRKCHVASTQRQRKQKAGI